MEIKTNGKCIKCPFLSHSTNSWDDDIYTCQLNKYLNPTNYKQHLVHVVELGNTARKIKTPDWCPLKKESVIVTI